MKLNKTPISRNQPVEDYVSFLLNENEIETVANSNNQPNSKIKSSDTNQVNSDSFISCSEKKLSLNKEVITEKKDNIVKKENVVEEKPILDEASAKDLIVDKALDPRLKKVKQLLAKIPFELSLNTSNEDVSNIEIKTQTSLNELSVEQSEEELIETSFLERRFTKARETLPDDFQTLVFKVGKQPFAVPLLKLGGIMHLNNCQITPLVGTPDWFLGLVPGERGNLMMIDTQKFLMPETIRSNNQTTNQAYNYLIILDNSHWALACHSMKDAKRLTKSDIRWIEKSSKRPWFSGMVIDYMSVLIEVDELINQLAKHITK